MSRRIIRRDARHNSAFVGKRGRRLVGNDVLHHAITRNSNDRERAVLGRSAIPSVISFNHNRLLSPTGTSDWTLHDLRRTFATAHASIGARIHVIEEMLNGVSGSPQGVAGI